MHVALVVKPGHDFLTTVQQALRAGRGPDLIDMSGFDVPRFVAQHILVPYQDAAPYTKDHFYAGLGTSYNKYGIPNSFDPVVLFYQKKLLPQLAFPQQPSTSVPWITYQQLAAAAQTYQKNTGKAAITIDLKSDPLLFSALVWQHQGTWFNTTSTNPKDFQVTINGPRSLDVASYWDRLVGSGAVNIPIDPTPSLSPANSLPPLIIGSLSLASVFKDQGISSQWGVALAPQDIDDPDHVTCGSAYYRWWGITRPLPVPPNPPVMEKMEEFIQWATTDEVSLTTQFAEGIFPTEANAYTLPDAQKLNDFYGIQGLAKVAQVSGTHLAPTFQYGPNMRFVYADQQRLFRGETFSSALTILQQDAVQNLPGS